MVNTAQQKLTADEWFLLLSVFFFTFFIVAVIATSPEFHNGSFPSALVLSAIFGATVGVAEIISRYRDEPLKACRSFYGLGYIYINAILGICALLLIWHYPAKFGFSPGSRPETFSSALLAGFGASLVMRTRLMVLKGADNKDVSIGPDLVIKYLLNMVDQYVDRYRAAARHHIVFNSLPELIALGNILGGFKSVADYLLVSLLALQNLEDERKKQLGEIFSNYDRQPLPDIIKYLAMGFVFLTVVGEDRYIEIIQNTSTNLTRATTALPPVQTPIPQSTDPKNQPQSGPPNTP